MAYNTRYRLTQERNPVSAASLAALIQDDTEAGFALGIDGSSCERSMWYKHEKSLCAMSAKISDTLLKLHGEGEEAGDVWDKYFVGGKKVHEVKLSPELPRPDYDKLVPDKKLRERQYVMDVPLIILATTEEEAKQLILDKLNLLKIEFDDTCSNDFKAQLLN